MARTSERSAGLDFDNCRKALATQYAITASNVYGFRKSGARFLTSARYLNRRTPSHITTLVLIVATAAISTNFFLASLPSMAEHFGVPYSIIQFTVSAYLALMGLVQLFIGPVSDRVGRRPAMIATLVLFALASLGAAMSTSFTEFMLFRCLQAVMVSGYIISYATVRDLTARENAASMIGYITMGMSVVPMVGPAIGGVLSDALGWQSNFFAMLVIASVTLAIVFLDQGETNATKSKSFAGQFKAYPELLTSRRFWGYTLVMVFASCTFFAFLGGAPFVGKQLYGLGPTQLGVYLSIVALGYMVGNGLSGRFAGFLGLYRMILLGSLATLTFMAPTLFTAWHGVTHPLGFFGFTFAIGLGNGMILPSANAGLLDVKPDLAGSAAGLSGSLMTLGGGPGYPLWPVHCLRRRPEPIP